MPAHKQFIVDYATAVTEGYAAVFAGAGLSCGSGYVNWKNLLRPLAMAINLDIDREHDLIAVAQFRRNEDCNRYAINQAILNEFTRDACENENIDILTRLPIATYWTTNYDELIENGLKKNNRKADVKKKQNSLAAHIVDRDAVVYKMHGDVNDPEEAVLTRDDYEMYEHLRPLFKTALKADLISKTFLFVGFSFEDPNLDLVLSRIRGLLGESIRQHYCFVARERRDRFGSDDEYRYACVKQELRVKDLRRYGIRAVLLDDFEEITQVLRNIEYRCLLKNIFISGSQSEFTPPWDWERASSFAHDLAKSLVRSDNKILSGFGLGIGSMVVNGALEEIMASKYKHTDEHLCLRPFPQVGSGSVPLKKLWTAYRREMIRQAGVAIFLFGNKSVDGKIVTADGMMEEFAIAKEYGKAIIPVGSTGGASADIFAEILRDKDKYRYLHPHLDTLQNSTDGGKLIEAIDDIVKCLKTA